MLRIWRIWVSEWKGLMEMLGVCFRRRVVMRWSGVVYGKLFMSEGRDRFGLVIKGWVNKWMFSEEYW